jgi:putative selenium metabolism hydrolase
VDAAALIDFTTRLVGASSPSAAEGDVAALVAAEMRRLGFRVEVDRLGNVTGSLGGGDGPTVLLDSHMDTVGVTDPAAWTHAPTGERVGDRLYGRGTMDMKGPLAASVYGAASLIDRLPRGRVVVSASVAEELVEGPALVEVARRVRPDYVVICEATSLQLATGQRGRAELRVEVHGQPTHSSRPELGVNAAQHMTDVIQALRAVTVPSHPVLGQGVLVLTDVLSRPYPALSVVPDYCVATYDRRTLPGESAEEVLASVRAALEQALAGSGAKGGVTVAEDDFVTYTGERITAPNFAPAWYQGESSEIVRKALAGLARVGLGTGTTHYAFCTNGSGTAGLGIPTVGFGPGDEEMAHRVDEYIEVSQLVHGALGYAGICRSLLAADA